MSYVKWNLSLGWPVAVVALVFRESPARYGLRFHLTRQMAVMYAVLAAVMLPVLYVASLRPSFQNTYPMVRNLGADPWRLAAWEASRALRFVALEFFFRGFLLFSLEARFGMHAIAVAALPYGVMHFGKPFGEALGAVVAGAVLGSQIARNQSGATTMPGYRVTVQTDQGLMRTYEVSATGDLRVGDRVRVDNGVIYRG